MIWAVLGFFAWIALIYFACLGLSATIRRADELVETPENTPSYALSTPIYEDNIFENLRYLEHDRQIHYGTDSNQTVLESEESAPDPCAKFFYRYFQSIITGDAETYRSYFTSDYLDRVVLPERFTMQMLYDIRVSEVGDLMGTDGEDKWNQATQFQQPAAVTSDTYAVVADIKGTDMYLFDEKGLVKQLTTTKPIEKVTVGHDGTVAVIQENGSTPVVSCYNKDGKILLKHQASLSESGYPISAAVSEDGDVLALSYLRAGSTGASGRISFFAIKTQEKDNTLFSEDLKSQIAGEVFFIDKTAVVVGEKECFLYQGFESPKKKTIDIDGEIEKVFRDGRYFGFVLRMSSGEKSLRVYNRSGSEKLNKTVTGNYDKVLMLDKQVLLFSGQECCIYTLRGTHRFDGQMRDGVLFVMPVGGINRYAVITYDGIDTVYLTK